MSENNYLHWLGSETPTQWWNDSGDLQELESAMLNGAVGVTTNPVLSATVLKKNPNPWKDSIQLVLSGSGSISEKAEDLVGIVVKASAEKVYPVFEKTNGAMGYVCAQVNPSLSGERDAMMAMAKKFASFAPNISVKLPATAAGLDVLEECAALGIHTTGTVSFTLPQMVAVAERHRLGTQRAVSTGIKPATCVSVIMIGRIDDYLREVIQDNGLTIDEGDIRQAGLAILKKAYSIFQERKYSAKICVAALRGSYHATEIAGADLILSVHPKYQKILIEQDLSREERINIPVEPSVIDRLKRVREFSRAYEEDEMPPDDFITYGATQRTVSQFIESGWKQIESFCAVHNH